MIWHLATVTRSACVASFIAPRSGLVGSEQKTSRAQRIRLLPLDPLLLAGVFLAARNGRHTLLRHNQYILRAEASDGNFNPVRRFAGFGDIERWVALIISS
jgi:hypothetical protein